MAQAGISKGNDFALIEVKLLKPELIEVRAERLWIQVDLQEATQLVNDLREALRSAYAPQVKSRLTAEVSK